MGRGVLFERPRRCSRPAAGQQISRPSAKRRGAQPPEGNIKHLSVKCDVKRAVRERLGWPTECRVQVQVVLLGLRPAGT